MPRTTERPASRDLALAIAHLLDERKCSHLAVLELGPLCSFTDFFVIATVESGAQLRGVAAALTAALDDAGISAQQEPVLPDTTWAVLDVGDVVVHLFLPDARAYYDLERLWGDAALLPADAVAEFSLVPGGA